METCHTRPYFPKRAVVTAGMPYGNKELHLGHIGGVFVHADTFARFLRDRIGKENVLFVSGTDCFGSPILEHYRQLVKCGAFEGSIEEFVDMNHERQKEALEAFHISLNLFAASSIGDAAKIHQALTYEFIQKLYENGHLMKLSTMQFYDPVQEVFLNGRQVVGQCPISGCASDRGYADECSLGHQYMPADLINPKSTLSGNRPEMREVTNWYFNLEGYKSLLKEWVADLEGRPNARGFMVNSIKEFLEPPVIYIKKEHRESVDALLNKLPACKLEDQQNKSSILLIFEDLASREEACKVLSDHSIRYRTGKTLVPFRLTGNIEWGVKAPELEELKNLTVWVWPESLWAPISFTQAFLEDKNEAPDGWKNWWCSKEAKVYQFIGEDNVYFYGPVEMAMFMGTQGQNPTADPEDGQLQLPDLIANNHLLFLDKKASSSGNIKPPLARELLDYYTPEQLRAHFLGLGLSIRSVSFQPKPFNPKAQEKDSDPVLKEGNLLTNVLNRAVRSCFYSVQKYYNGKIPVASISSEVMEESKKTILEYENMMYKYEFHQVMNLMDSYIRTINKEWSRLTKQAEEAGDEILRTQVLVDTFHRVRTASVLMHPIAPEGTEMIRSYLNLGEDFWNWEHIFESVYYFMDDPSSHTLRFLEPRIDFFKKHASQIKEMDETRSTAP